MRLRENLIVIILFVAVLAEGMLTATHCFEPVTPQSATQLALALPHDNDCELHGQSSTAVIAPHDSVKAVPAMVAFDEFISQPRLASRGVAPHELGCVLLSPPHNLNSILRI